MLNDIFDCDNVGTVTSLSEINVLVKLHYFFSLNVSVFHKHLCNKCFGEITLFLSLECLCISQASM